MGYRAIQAKDVTASKLRDEIHATSQHHLRELLSRGYAYRLCVCDGSSEAGIVTEVFLRGSAQMGQARSD